MPLFGRQRGRGIRGSFATRTQGVPKNVRARRARKGHRGRQHIGSTIGAKPGRKTTYRTPRKRFL